MPITEEQRSQRKKEIDKNIRRLKKKFDRYLFSEIMTKDYYYEEKQFLLKGILCSEFKDFILVSCGFAGFEKEEKNSGYEFAVNATLYKDDVFYNCIYLEGGFCVYTHVTTHVCLLSFPESIYNRKYDDED